MTRRHTKSLPPCPRCSSARVVPIGYGLPTAVAAEQAKRGEIVLGGCCVTGDDPKWFCCDCGWAWNANRGVQWEKR